MKESKYNYFKHDNTGMVLYNALIDEIIILRPELANVYLQHRNDPEEIKKNHLQFFDYLCEKRFFVDETQNETDDVIARWIAEDNNGVYNIIINPTLNCNMKCWYCYEKTRTTDFMTTELIDKIKLHMDNVVTGEKYNTIALSFFGGEPLLHSSEVVFPLIDYLEEICKAHNIKTIYHFTTNAYLLDSSLSDKFKGLDVSFQITFDGNEKRHNQIRKTTENEPTYRKILQNVYYAVKSGFNVGIRFNYTKATLPTFIDVISDFKDLPVEDKQKLNFNFQRIWQDDNDCGMTHNEVTDRVRELETCFEKEGLNVDSANSYSVSRCYADNANSIIINYNGDIYKCTARDFTQKTKEGILNDNGIIEYNDRYTKRMNLRWGNDTCKACVIYPICHGGCSQQKMESAVKNGCVKGYDKTLKEEILKGRLLFLLDELKKQSKKS